MGERSVGWLNSEVQALLNARVMGQTDAEIKALVADLESQRKHFGGCTHAQ